MRLCQLKVVCLTNHTILWSRPFVEYKGVVPQSEVPVKQKELEAEANELISKGGKVCLRSLFIYSLMDNIWWISRLRLAERWVSVHGLLNINWVYFALYQVYAAILPYEEASLLCGGTLPDYIPKVFICQCILPPSLMIFLPLTN